MEQCKPTQDTNQPVINQEQLTTPDLIPNKEDSVLLNDTADYPSIFVPKKISVPKKQKAYAFPRDTFESATFEK